MKNPTSDIATALARRSLQGHDLWLEVRGDTKFARTRALRRYAACMRLCHWLQQKLKTVEK